MPISAYALPYGLRDVKLKALSSSEVLGSAVDLPVSRTFSFEDAEDFEDLRGDDTLVATHGQGAQVNWELESGGISLEAAAVLLGGTISQTGTTPNVIKKLAKVATDARPYFQVEGQSISDSGGDFHIKLYKCKVTGNFSGEMAEGSFWISNCTGLGLSKTTGELYDIIHNETVTAIT